MATFFWTNFDGRLFDQRFRGSFESRRCSERSRMNGDGPVYAAAGIAINQKGVRLKKVVFETLPCTSNSFVSREIVKKGILLSPRRLPALKTATIRTQGLCRVNALSRRHVAGPYKINSIRRRRMNRARGARGMQTILGATYYRATRT